MPVDLAAARRDTPGCAGVLHLDSAGSSLPPRRVTDAVIAHLRREEMVGGYTAEAEAEEGLASVYDAAARLIVSDRSEIALVDSATRAWDTAFYGFRLSRGDRVLVDRARYPSYAVAMLQVAGRTGAVLEVVDDDVSGQLDLADLERRLDGAALVALTHIPTESGLINPVAAAGQLCRDAGVPLLVDACQSVGQLDVDVDALHCDMLAATGRKYLRGPRGTGFLYVRSSLFDRVEPPVIDTRAASWIGPDDYLLQPDARRYESYERSVAAVLGLGAALGYALEVGTAEIEERVLRLGGIVRDRLAAIDGVRLHRRGERECGIVPFTVDGRGARAVQRALLADGIVTSVSAPAPGSAGPGAVAGPPRIRASVHYYTSEDEVEVFAAAVEALARA